MVVSKWLHKSLYKAVMNASKGKRHVHLTKSINFYSLKGFFPNRNILEFSYNMFSKTICSFPVEGTGTLQIFVSDYKIYLYSL